MNMRPGQFQKIGSSHFQDITNLAFQELKPELELQDKTVTFDVSEDVASVTIEDGEVLELHYELRVMRIEANEENEENEENEAIISIIQYLNADGKMVRKEAPLLHAGMPIEPVKITREMMINDILNKYRSSNPFAKIVMSPYTDFHK